MLLRGATTQNAGKVLIINSDSEITKILKLNLGHANLEVVSAQNGAEALSKIATEQADIIILDPVLPDIDGIEICRQINELSQTRHIPVILISTQPQESKKVQLDEISNYFVTKPFNPNEIVALVQGFLTCKERMVNTNPLTGLPNRTQVSREIERLIHRKTIFTALFAVIHDIKAINKAYGYSQGDRVIQLLADVVSETVRLFGNPDDLAGYFGGDKFVVITTPWKAKTLCQRIITDFNRRIKSLYTDEVLQTGCVSCNGPVSAKEQNPIMSIHIASVTNQERTFSHPLEVAEAAFEQIGYLRCSPESNCYYDLQVNGITSSLTLTDKEMLHARKMELKAIQGVISWFDFLIEELSTPIQLIGKSLYLMESMKTMGLSQEQLNSLRELESNYNCLIRAVDGIADLANPRVRANDFFDEVDISILLRWVAGQVKELAEEKGIKIDIQDIDNAGRLMGDRKSLTQALLYIVRSEVQASPSQSQLNICLLQENEEFINIEITNPDHYIRSKSLDTFLQDHPGTSQQEILKNELYPASVLIRGLGGRLEVSSEQGKGVSYKISIPLKWPRWMQELDTLQLATDISRKEARDALNNIQCLISSPAGQLPPPLNDNLMRLSSKVQELGVLCNRSQFLADDLSSRLEAQQDLLLHREVEQVATIEAILVMCREMAKTMHMDIFKLESAKKVARYALAIAGELKLSESDRKTLRYAALFKDIALAFSPDNLNNKQVPAIDAMPADIRERVNLVWKSLSTIPIFSPACDLVQYRHERYDGIGWRFGVRGADIPLGARILAVADTFDYLMSGRSPLGKLSVKQAVEKIVEDSGLSYDPHVISAFLMLWKRKQLELI